MSSIELLFKNMQKINKKSEKVSASFECGMYSKENVSKMETEKFAKLNNLEQIAYECTKELEECQKRLENWKNK